MSTMEVLETTRRNHQNSFYPHNSHSTVLGVRSNEKYNTLNERPTHMHYDEALCDKY